MVPGQAQEVTSVPVQCKTTRLFLAVLLGPDCGGAEGRGQALHQAAEAV